MNSITEEEKKMDQKKRLPDPLPQYYKENDRNATSSDLCCSQYFSKVMEITKLKEKLDLDSKLFTDEMKETLEKSKNISEKEKYFIQKNLLKEEKEEKKRLSEIRDEIKSLSKKIITLKKCRKFQLVPVSESIEKNLRDMAEKTQYIFTIYLDRKNKSEGKYTLIVCLRNIILECLRYIPDEVYFSEIGEYCNLPEKIERCVEIYLIVSINKYRQQFFPVHVKPVFTEKMKLTRYIKIMNLIKDEIIRGIIENTHYFKSIAHPILVAKRYSDSIFRQKIKLIDLRKREMEIIHRIKKMKFQFQCLANQKIIFYPYKDDLKQIITLLSEKERLKMIEKVKFYRDQLEILVNNIEYLVLNYFGKNSHSSCQTYFAIACNMDRLNSKKEAIMKLFMYDKEGIFEDQNEFFILYGDIGSDNLNIIHKLKCKLSNKIFYMKYVAYDEMFKMHYFNYFLPGQSELNSIAVDLEELIKINRPTSVTNEKDISRELFSRGNKIFDEDKSLQEMKKQMKYYFRSIKLFSRMAPFSFKYNKKLIEECRGVIYKKIQYFS